MSWVWFITGAGTASAASEAGRCVVAAGGDVGKVRRALRDVAGGSLAVLRPEARLACAADRLVLESPF